MSQARPSSIIELVAETLAVDGSGVATSSEGTQVSVPNLLPGERALVEIDHVSPHRNEAWGHITERLGQESPNRVPTSCPAFGKCGGCVWQHLDYPNQLAHKTAQLSELFSNLAPDVVVTTVPSPLQLGYRNKGKYVFAESEGQVLLGAFKPRTHEVVSTLGCKIVEPAIDSVAEKLQSLVQEQALPIYSEEEIKRAGKSVGLRYAILRSNEAGEVLVVLVCTSDMADRDLAELSDALLVCHEVCGVLRCDNDVRSGLLLTDNIKTLGGDSTLAEKVSGVTVPIGAKSFLQVNRAQADNAYQALAKAIPSAQRVLELYSGVGGIAFALAAKGHHVEGIESDPGAVQTANDAAQVHGLSSVRFRCADATKLEQSDFQNVDAIVVDPPRKGLGTRGVEQLIAAAPKHVAYLSCSPKSLAKDLRALVAAGYTVTTVTCLDFMPGTAQIECLTILQAATELES